MPVCQARLKALYISKAAAQVAADLLKNLVNLWDTTFSRSTIDPEDRKNNYNQIKGDRQAYYLKNID